MALTVTPSLSALTLSWSLPTGSYASIVKWRKVGASAWSQAVPALATSLVLDALEQASYELQVVLLPTGGVLKATATPDYPPPPTPVAPVLTVAADNSISWPAQSGVSAWKGAISDASASPRSTTYVNLGSATTWAPPAVPGQTCWYGLAAASPSGPWASEVAIAWPPATPPPPPPTPTSSGVVIGINDALGWGVSPSAAALKAAHITCVRANYANASEHPDVLLANGLTPGCALIGNTSDGTPLSSIDINSWVSSAASQADDAVANCGVALPLEVGNEVYLKGGGSAGNPVKYAQMFDALARARPTYNLLFCSFGDYQLPNGSWSQVSAGRGWLGDALAAVPALKDEVCGFVNHPYGNMKPTPANGGNSWGPGALVAQHDQAVKLGFAHADSWWLTEYGSSYPKASDGDPQDVDCQVAYGWFIGLGYVRGIFWFQFRDYAGMNPPASGAFNSDFSPRPVVSVLKAFAVAQGQ